MRKADNLPPSCAVFTKSGNLNFLEPSGPVQACNGTGLPLPFIKELYLNGNTWFFATCKVIILSSKYVYFVNHINCYSECEVISTRLKYCIQSKDLRETDTECSFSIKVF